MKLLTNYFKRDHIKTIFKRECYDILDLVNKHSHNYGVGPLLGSQMPVCWTFCSLVTNICSNKYVYKRQDNVSNMNKQFFSKIYHGWGFQLFLQLCKPGAPNCRTHKLTMIKSLSFSLCISKSCSLSCERDVFTFIQRNASECEQ